MTVDPNHVVWGDMTVWANHIVWGDSLLSIVDGLHVVWGDHVVWGEHIVWGDSVLDETTDAVMDLTEGSLPTVSSILGDAASVIGTAAPGAPTY